MNPRVKDLQWQQFGRLKVIAFVDIDKFGNARWKCQCNCGRIKIVRSHSLVSGQTKSCGRMGCKVSGDVRLGRPV